MAAKPSPASKESPASKAPASPSPSLPGAASSGHASILVTGATGFLGAHLIRELVRRGDGPLRAMQSGRAPQWLTDLGVEVVTGSVTSPGDVARALDGIDRVYHLAGFVSQKPADAHRMYEVHVDGTRILCQAAAAAGVRRIVLASTSGTVAVSARAGAYLDETSPAPVDVIGRWPYYASKLYQEEAARSACGDRVELVTLNPSLLLGPGDDRLSSTRVVLQFLGREIALTPTGDLNFVDVRDVAALLPTAMERGATGERYLVGGTNWTFAEFFGRLERMTKVSGPLFKGRGKLPWFAVRAQAAIYRRWGKTPPLEPSGVDMAGYYWTFESTKAARDLGWAPRAATETLFDTVRYVREHFLASDALGRAS
jgi:dihydroflavonol-4-reductase